MIANAALALTSTLTPINDFHADYVRDSEWHLKYLDIETAHAITKGNDVTIGLVDTGVFPHRDIVNNLLNGADLTTTNGTQGKKDRDGHGTEMAGLIVGHGHNYTEGILGIAPSAHLLPIKSYEVARPDSNLAGGIKAAVTHGSMVINVSAGTSPSIALRAAVSTAAQFDAVIVAASGNDQTAAGFGYPAALPGVLAVGAINRSGKHASFSITGPNMDLCAPGAEISTTGLNNTYRKAQGTSAATAIVSGAAALVRAKFPELSAPEVIHRLTATATDIGPPGRDEQCGYGVLNIVKALTADVPPLVGASDSGPTVGSPSPGATAEGPPAGSGTGDSESRKVAVLGGIATVSAASVLVAFLSARRRRRKQP
ncbi:S8 family serine peptidase [Actinoplanes teichomyceticus]|nr:S8 family serine peptidase [Actinoplanes teichomyceticus]GIF10872.1 type VII secretion-associated serine protease [Actinoplanes teichomyceticus]